MTKSLLVCFVIFAVLVDSATCASVRLRDKLDDVFLINNSVITNSSESVKNETFHLAKNGTDESFKNFSLIIIPDMIFPNNDFQSTNNTASKSLTASTTTIITSTTAKSTTHNETTPDLSNRQTFDSPIKHHCPDGYGRDVANECVQEFQCMFPVATSY